MSSSYFPWDDAQEATLRRMWASGDGPTAIARALHTSVSSVMNKANRLGLPTRRPRGVVMARADCSGPLRASAHTLPPLPSEMPR